MSSPEPALVVIECPHCGTRYQLDYDTLGDKGRRVACAHCGNSWKARAEQPETPATIAAEDPMAAVAAAPPAATSNRAFGELAEEMLDEKFIAEERRHRERREASAKAHAEELAARVRARVGADPSQGDAADSNSADEALSLDNADMEPSAEPSLDDIKAAIAPRKKLSKSEAEAARKRQREFSARQRSLADSLPIARLRRVARLAALAALVLVIGGGIMFRAAAVQQFPQLAAAYAAVGLGVNVVGLEFHNVRTLKSLQNGSEILQVDGDIASVANREAVLPQVVVTLLGKTGNPLYEWSVTPKASELEPGETLAFQTQLSAPPKGATGVKLSFANGRAKPRPLDDDMNDDDTAPSEAALSPPPTVAPGDDGKRAEDQ